MSGAAQAECAPPTGPDASAPGRRRWLIAATVAWAFLLALLVWISVRNDPPTVREQRSLAEAGPRVDAAVGELVAASGPAVLELVPARVERDCRLTPLAGGATLTRDVEAIGAVGAERELLEGIADRLPASWRAGVRLTPDGVRLRADAGEFVSVEGRPTADGRVRLTVETGCRPLGAGYPPAGHATAGGPAGAEAAALAGALRALGEPADAAPELVTASCPGGGVARTAVAAVGGGAVAAATALAPLATGGPVLETPEAYAYRTGAVVVLADTAAGHPHVAATTPCP
ncbi:hypothetical protein [Micromonospora sp. URMC 103]|uniref:hypothetical protein n=1 Tax=Micromonospora sp. URMC 103 TaxID=3423406 RepID=UPI003F1E352B